MNGGQAHAGFPIGLHIPDAGTSPVVVVAPGVDLELATDGNAVNIGTEDLTTINQQLCMANAIVVISEFRIVVRPQGKAYPAPRRKATVDGPGSTLSLDVRLPKAENLLATASIEHTLALNGNSHEAMGLRSNSISHHMT